jgi:hypothetical protein
MYISPNVGALRDALSRCQNQTKATRSLLRGISELSYCEYPIEREFGAGGVLDTLVEILPTSTGDVTEDVIRAICNITVDQTNALRYAELGGPTVALKLASQLTRSDSFRAVCVGCVLNALSNGADVQIPNEDVKALIQTAGESLRVRLVTIIIGCFLLPSDPALHSMARNFFGVMPFIRQCLTETSSHSRFLTSAVGSSKPLATVSTHRSSSF